MMNFRLAEGVLQCPVLLSYPTYGQSQGEPLDKNQKRSNPQICELCELCVCMCATKPSPEIIHPRARASRHRTPAHGWHIETDCFPEEVNLLKSSKQPKHKSSLVGRSVERKNRTNQAMSRNLPEGPQAVFAWLFSALEGKLPQATGGSQTFFGCVSCTCIVDPLWKERLTTPRFFSDQRQVLMPSTSVDQHLGPPAISFGAGGVHRFIVSG